MVGRLHLHVSFLNYLLYSRGIHWYGSPYLPLGRLLCGIRGHLGPLARIAQGDSGAPVARLPYKTHDYVLNSFLPLCAFWCFSRSTCHRARVEQGCAGGFPHLGRCRYLFLWAGVTRHFMRQ